MMIKIKDPNEIRLAKKNKKRVIIFLDLDGVSSFWLKSAAKKCDIDIEDPEIREQLKNGKDLEDLVGGVDKLWEKIGKEHKEEKFWEELEIFDWAKKLVEELQKRGTDFCFLTSPSNNPVCASGKVKWIKKHFGEKFKDFLIGKKKYLCATPHSILIDDNEKKCKKFEEYGGKIFLWPNAFKIIDGDINIDDVFEDLFEKIEKMKN